MKPAVKHFSLTNSFLDNRVVDWLKQEISKKAIKSGGAQWNISVGLLNSYRRPCRLIRIYRKGYSPHHRESQLDTHSLQGQKRIRKDMS